MLFFSVHTFFGFFTSMRSQIRVLILMTLVKQNFLKVNLKGNEQLVFEQFIGFRKQIFS